MVQVKIYGLKDKLNVIKYKLSDIIHSCLVEVLGLPVEKKFQRFFLLNKEDFFYPTNRTEDYTIIEIILFKGRQKETIKQLIYYLIKRIKAELSISENDIEIFFLESKSYKWGIRGRTGDELDLSYDIHK